MGSNESSETIHDDKNEPKDDLDPPLRFATLSGRQELVLKFTEMNQFGLPRAVDEVEVGLGRLCKSLQYEASPGKQGSLMSLYIARSVTQTIVLVV